MHVVLPQGHRQGWDCDDQPKACQCDFWMAHQWTAPAEVIASQQSAIYLDSDICHKIVLDDVELGSLMVALLWISRGALCAYLHRRIACTGAVGAYWHRLEGLLRDGGDSVQLHSAEQEEDGPELRIWMRIGATLWTRIGATKQMVAPRRLAQPRQRCVRPPMVDAEYGRQKLWSVVRNQPDLERTWSLLSHLHELHRRGQHELLGARFGQFFKAVEAAAHAGGRWDIAWTYAGIPDPRPWPGGAGGLVHPAEFAAAAALGPELRSLEDSLRAASGSESRGHSGGGAAASSADPPARRGGRGGSKSTLPRRSRALSIGVTDFSPEFWKSMRRCSNSFLSLLLAFRCRASPVVSERIAGLATAAERCWRRVVPARPGAIDRKMPCLANVWATGGGLSGLGARPKVFGSGLLAGGWARQVAHQVPSAAMTTPASQQAGLLRPTTGG